MRVRHRCVSGRAAESTLNEPKTRSPAVVVPVLGVTQIIAWGSSYYLLAVLAKPIALDTGWPLAWVVAGLSLGLLSAGLCSPAAGDRIERHGGTRVLAVSTVLMAIGLIAMALAPALPIYLLAWLVIGIGMGSGLYEAAFATLGQLFQLRARAAITTLTLFGGFASTACWPLSALMVSRVGWRATCLIYAGIHLGVLLPLYCFALPNAPARGTTESATKPTRSGRASGPVPDGARLLFVLLAATFTVASMISTAVSVHLLSILQARDIALTAAVALGALVGPSQVGARAIEMLISRYHHPIWTMIAATIFVAIGVGMLWARLPLLSAALVFYGAGIGIESIARGTLPLALFGPTRYAALMGRIAMPSLIAQAAAPSLGALLMQNHGSAGTLTALFATALVDVALVVALFVLYRRHHLAHSSHAAVE